ncbi:MAG: NADH-quinone oxidoreductase subunit N [Bdellovibrionales bacterium]|nr:NADH-quinone oxidoreductase subunit N [Bdellovibrionales bacterium]
MMADLEMLRPWIFLASGILLTLLISVIRTESKRPAQISALLTVLGTAIFSFKSPPSEAVFLFSGALEVSSLSLFALGGMSVLAAMFILGTGHYLTREKIHISDYYHLLLILVLGGSVLVASRNLLLSFIALEVMSLPAYTLVGFRRNDSRSNEAALKYFILGGAMGAVFLLGSSFIFGATGTLDLSAVFTESKGGTSLLLQLGHLLVVLAFLFKVAAAPLHFWKPDVYEGAPTPVTGIMATIITSASFLGLIRLIHMIDFSSPGTVGYLELMKSALRVAAIASLVVGSSVMITQRSLKRMLAYSSITHTGYLLLGVLGAFDEKVGITSVLVYLLGYCVMSTGAFVLLTLAKAPADTGTELIDLTGLIKRSPFLTFLWTVFFFSMAGMPFTVGFFTKYSVFMASLGGGETVLVILAAICTVVGAYAYLRAIALMTMRDAAPAAGDWEFSPGSQIVAIVAAGFVLFLGIIPNAMIQYLKGIPLIH